MEHFLSFDINKIDMLHKNWKSKNSLKFEILTWMKIDIVIVKVKEKNHH